MDVNRSNKQNVLNSSLKKKCSKCGINKKMRDYELRILLNKWYPYSYCKLCKSRRQNQRRKSESYKPIAAKYNKASNKKHKETLSDVYVKQMLARNSKIGYAEWKNHPEIIEARRNLIKLNRMLNGGI